MKDNEKKFDLPLLEAPRTMRIRFRKVGNLQYISHLDLQRTFARVLVRAGLPLWYTKGFNPHIKMVFGMPLPVGAESETEFLDVRIEREMSAEEMMTRLNGELTEELAVTAVYPAERKFSDIVFAEYEYTLKDAAIDAGFADKVRALFAEEGLTVEKKTKTGSKQLDVSGGLLRFEVSAKEGEATLTAVLAAGEGRYLTPEALITLLRERTGIFAGLPTNHQYRILRRRALLADGVSEFC